MRKLPKGIKSVIGLSFFLIFASFFVCSADDENIIWLDKKFSDQSYVTLEGPYPKLNEKFGFIEGLAPIGMVDGKSGYIDKNGKLVFKVPGEKTFAYNFHEGIGCAMEDDKTIYLDKKGRVLKKVYSGGNFSEGLCPVKLRESDKWSYVNKDFNNVLTIDYDYPGDFKEGLAMVGIQIKNSFYPDETFKYGYIDRSGKLVIPVKYDYAFDFKDGVALVFLGEKKMYIDRNGKEVKRPKKEKSMVVTNSGEKFGFRDEKGVVSIPAVYDSVSDFSDGLAKVEINGKYGYIDINGKLVIPALYDEDSNDFSEGAAIIKKDGRLGIIKKPEKNMSFRERVRNFMDEKIKNLKEAS